MRSDWAASGSATMSTLLGMAGGYALSGRGPLWARIASGVVALSIIPIWALTVTSFAGSWPWHSTHRGAHGLPCATTR